MTEREAIAIVMNCRSRLSHDLIKNEFIHLVGAGWRDKEIRGTSKDVIYSGLLNLDTPSNQAIVEASSAWEQKVLPGLQSFISEITDNYGFVPAAKWHETTEKILAQATFISQQLKLNATLPQDKALSVSSEIWSAIDEIVLFLDKLGRKLWDYFDCFDPRRVKG